MNKLFLLLKINLRESLDKRKYKENKKQQAFIIYASLLGILMVAISGFYSFIYGRIFIAANATDNIYYLTLTFFVATSFTTFTSTISKMQTVFLGSDLEMLQALPLRKKDIVLSKIFNLYIVELLICLVILVPNSIVSLILTKNFLYLAIIPLAFIAPAFPMLVALFVTALLELLIKNQKIKTIISTVALLSVFVLIMAFSFISGFNNTNNMGMVNMFEAVGNAAKYINPSLLFITKGLTENPLWLLAFLGSNLVLLVIVLTIVTIAFNKIHNNLVAVKLSSQNKKLKEKPLVVRTQSKEIRHLTIKNFFRSKNSLIQCGIGIIMVLTFAIIMAVCAKANLIMIEDSNTHEKINLFSIFKEQFFVVAVIFSFFLSIMPPSASAISLEGENFYTLKSLPIDFKSYLKQKLLFSFLVLLIPSLFASILLSIFVPQSIFSIIILIVFPFIFSLFISEYTLIINSAFPYLKWKEEIEVYKYHKSTLISVFTDMGISIATILLTIGLVMINPIIAGVVLIIIYGGLSIGLYFILMKVSSKKLSTLEISD